MRNTLMAASVLALIAGSASAATMSYSVTDSLSSTTLNFVNQNLSVAAFDTGLGTLTGVQISVLGSSTLNYSSFCSGGPCSLSAVVFPGFGSVGPLISATLNLTGPTSFALTVAPSSNLTTYSGAATGTTNTQNSLTGTDSGSAADTDLSAYTAGGLVAFLLDGNVGLITKLGGSQSQTSTGDAALDLTVTYTYEEVAAIPVPAALPLLATAFGALGLLRLRRKA
ncbi:MAG: hypothetical protein ACI9ZH_001294 [Paracoccaceae bacterium]|jgi:hypothetical protein